MSAHAVPQLLRWHDLAVFVGRLGEVGAHLHHAPALLVGLQGAFDLGSEATGWRACHGAWLPTGLRHRLDVRGQRLAVVYFDAVLYGPFTGAPVLAVSGQEAWLRSAREALSGLETAADPVEDLRQHLVADVVPRGGVLGPARSDAQLMALRQALVTDACRGWSLPQAAQHAGLSASRFSHRFAERTGVSWTAYRNWTRLLDACVELAATPHALTRIALDHGYSSAAHFAASFRRSLGISPSELRGMQPQLWQRWPAADI